MGLERNRRRIFVRGLSTLSVCERLPSAGTSFSDVGYLNNASLIDAREVDDIPDENGNLVDTKEKSRVVTLEAALQQTSKDELDLVRNAVGKLYAARFYGIEDPTGSSFKYFCLPKSRILSSISQDYKPGLRLLPVVVRSLYDEEAGYVIPELFSVEAAKELRIASLRLWVDPLEGFNAATAKLLDISGFGRDATLNSDFASIWSTAAAPVRFLRFDGVNDNASFGDVDALDDDGTSDFLIEVWFRVQGADGTTQIVLGKKSVYSDNSAGFVLFRWGTGNVVIFKLSDGSASSNVTTVATVLQNVWTHYAVAVDRNGNAQGYVNGVATGTPTSVSARTSGANSEPLYLGRTGATYGQTDAGAVRIYNFGAGGLPSNVATIVSNHYNGEKAKYGL